MPDLKKIATEFKMEQRKASSTKSNNSPSRLATVEDYDQNPPNSDLKNKDVSNYLFITSLNVRTLLSDSRITELNYATKQLKWDIMGICETGGITKQ